MGHSAHLSLAHNPAVVPLPEIPSPERMQQLPTAVPVSGRNLFFFLELLDIVQNHTLFNYKAINAEDNDQNVTKIMSR